MMDLLRTIEARADAVPLWLEPWILLSLGLGAALLAHALIWRLIEGGLDGSRSLRARLVRRMRRPARLALVLLVFAVLLEATRLPPGWPEALRHGAGVLLILIAGWTLMIAIDFFGDRTAERVALDAADNLHARKVVTQARVLRRAAKLVVGLLTAALILSTFDGVRAFGVSLFASAGAAGIVLGFAAQPVLANLIAGLQIAITQPIRIDDVVIVEGEWGRIEEIGATYVVIRIWDLRRLIVPLSYFIDKPFQNWTRETATILGSVHWYLDHTAPIAAMRARHAELVAASPHWDGQTEVLQVVETDRDVIHVRGLMSARDAATAFDLRCEVREKMISWLQAEHPGALPRVRAEIETERRPVPEAQGGGAPQRMADATGIGETEPRS